MPPTYKILTNILLSRLIPYADEIFGYHQRGFGRISSTTDHIFCIRQTLEKKIGINEVVHQLFMNFKKSYDSVMKEVLYNILIDFAFTMKLIRLMNMFLTEKYSRGRVGWNFSDMFPVRNGLK